ncbi:MAG: hypothetical protein QOF21_3068 [Actinomycetota bacterium]|jgi:hypothetical protein
MTTTHSMSAVDAYIADVRGHLADLPDEERGELLEDVAAHVQEVANEHGVENLRERLGSPEAFADELRTSAGYAARETSRRAGAVRRWRALLPDKMPERVAPVWEKLEPAWWLARGVFLALLVLTASDTGHGIVPRIGSSYFLGLIVLIVAAAASYRLGERRPATQTVRLRKARIIGEVSLAVFGFFFLLQAANPEVRYVSYDNGAAAQDPCLRDSAGRAIGNLFAFDSTGKLIPQFFLTDQAGRGIDNLCPDQADGDRPGGPAQTSYARDANGAPIYNVFPRAQQRPTAIDPSTGQPTASEPVPAPAVLFPQIATTTTMVTPSG